MKVFTAQMELAAIKAKALRSSPWLRLFQALNSKINLKIQLQDYFRASGRNVNQQIKPSRTR